MTDSALWVSSAILVIVLIGIVWSEVRSGRHTKDRLAKTNRVINALAKSAFDKYRDQFEKDPTGVFELPADVDIDLGIENDKKAE